MIMQSLRGRLFLGLTAVIVLAGALGGLLTYQWAFDEAIEMQDSVLIQIGSVLQHGAQSAPAETPLAGVDSDAEVVIRELGTAPRGAVADRQLWGFADGLRTDSLQGRPVRLLLRSRPDGSRFAVAQQTAIRNEIAGELAFRALVPIAALIPCLMLVTALVINRSFQPVKRLAAKLNARQADDLDKLPVENAPRELHPFIASINGLLERIRLMVDQQRRFIADAAHELRTPVTALSLQAENLEQLLLSDDGRARLASLRTGMSRTKHLLEQLLALARYEMGRPGKSPLVSLDQVAKDVVAELLPEAVERGVDLGFEIIEPSWVRAELVTLAAMIRNLLDNALRFTPRGGHIDLGIYRQGKAAVLQIEDSGPGIAPADMARIFEPFYRGGRPSGDGSGLGLSIVKRIVENLGGTIAIENIQGAGLSGLRVTVELHHECDARATGRQQAPAAVPAES
jgi:two-component system, OmpR family, sensor kinase